MAKRDEEFVVNIPVVGEEALRGKFKVKLRLSYAEMLAMDAMRRTLLGPNPDGADQLVAVIAHAVSKIRTHATVVPSWWKDADNGLGFEDINVVLAVLAELNKVEKAYNDEITAAAGTASEALKKEIAP